MEGKKSKGVELCPSVSQTSPTSFLETSCNCPLPANCTCSLWLLRQLKSSMKLLVEHTLGAFNDHLNVSCNRLRWFCYTWIYSYSGLRGVLSGMLLFTHGFSPGKLISHAFHVSLEWWPLPFLAHLCSHYKGAALTTSFGLGASARLVLSLVFGEWPRWTKVKWLVFLVSHTCTRQSDSVLWGTRSKSWSRIGAQSLGLRTLNIGYLWLSKALVPDSLKYLAGDYLIIHSPCTWFLMI